MALSDDGLQLVRTLYETVYAPAFPDLVAARHPYLSEETARRLTTWDRFHTCVIAEYAGDPPQTWMAWCDTIERAVTRLFSTFASDAHVYWWPYSETWDVVPES